MLVMDWIARTFSLISKINIIEELNVGHFIISQSIFDGLEKYYKKVLEK